MAKGSKGKEWERVLALPPDKREAERLRANLASQKYRELNREKLMFRQREKRKKFIEREALYNAEAYRKRTAWYKEYAKNLYQEKKEEYRISARARKQKKKLATPPWANKDLIKLIYAYAAEVTQQEGIKYTVDHIIPLNGKNVSGLHVETNLQIIPMTFNVRKRGRLMTELRPGEFLDV